MVKISKPKLFFVGDDDDVDADVDVDVDVVIDFLEFFLSSIIIYYCVFRRMRTMRKEEKFLSASQRRARRDI